MRASRSGFRSTGRAARAGGADLYVGGPPAARGSPPRRAQGRRSSQGRKPALRGPGTKLLFTGERSSAWGVRERAVSQAPLRLKRSILRGRTAGDWLSADGRFRLVRLKRSGKKQWLVGAYTLADSQLLERHGIRERLYPTRAFALERLADALDLEQLSNSGEQLPQRAEPASSGFAQL